MAGTANVFARVELEIKEQAEKIMKAARIRNGRLTCCNRHGRIEK